MTLCTYAGVEDAVQLILCRCNPVRATALMHSAAACKSEFEEER